MKQRTGIKQAEASDFNFAIGKGSLEKACNQRMA